MKNKVYQKLDSCLSHIREKTDFKPKLALVLGSGLGDFADEIDIHAEIHYKDIPGFPVSTVPGHRGRFVFGYVGNVPVVIMQGRVHYYEGYSMEDVILPIRLMRLMGAEILFLTNAAGAIRTDLEVGSLMLIRDQISSLSPSPLIGENLAQLGSRFPDMSEIYSRDLRMSILETAGELGIPLSEGVYIQLTGPNFESPAEVKMYRLMGADAVGMSTACEAVAANHSGMKICGISCISNKAAGLTAAKLSHAEVTDAADTAAPIFKKLVWESILRVGNAPVPR